MARWYSFKCARNLWAQLQGLSGPFALALARSSVPSLLPLSWTRHTREQYLLCSMCITATPMSVPLNRLSGWCSTCLSEHTEDEPAFLDAAMQAGQRHFKFASNHYLWWCNTWCRLWCWTVIWNDWSKRISKSTAFCLDSSNALFEDSWNARLLPLRVNGPVLFCYAWCQAVHRPDQNPWRQTVFHYRIIIPHEFPI